MPYSIGLASRYDVWDFDQDGILDDVLAFQLGLRIQTYENQNADLDRPCGLWPAYKR